MVKKKTPRERKRSQRPSKKRTPQPAPPRGSSEANTHFRPRHTPVTFNRLPQPATPTPTWVQSDQGDENPQVHDQRKKVAASQSSLVDPLLPPSLTAVHEASPVTVFPTVYPQDPTRGGAVIVQNYIRINLNSVEFRQFDAKLDQLIEALLRSNEIAGEARDQSIAEMEAGLAILEAPKAERNLIEVLLRKPLLFLVKAAATSVISKLASEALALLGKLTGLW